MQRKFNMAEISRIRRSNKSIVELANQYHCSPSTIGHILENVCYYDETYQRNKEKPFDVPFAVELRKTGRTFVEISRLEQTKSGRKAPRSLSNVRMHIMKAMKNEK